MNKFGLKMPRSRMVWTDALDSALSKAYQRGGVSEASKALQLTTGQVRARAYRLRLFGPNRNTDWTPKMDAILSDVYVTKGKAAAMAALGLREGQIRQRASTLQLKAKGVSEACLDAYKMHSTKLRGRKRPEHSAMLKERIASGEFKPPVPDAAACAEISRKAKERIAANGHPRGALGMKHSDDTKKILSVLSKQNWAQMTEEKRAAWLMSGARTKEKNGTLTKPRMGTTWKSAWREFGGRRVFYRSRWEANYGRYLEWLKSRGDIREWEHEPKTFWFEGIKRGSVSYLPDFRVTENSGAVAYHEVKGWMDQRSKTKIDRMARYHPDVVLIVIAKPQYLELERKISALITGWEAR